MTATATMHHHEQAIAGEEEELGAQRRRQPGRNWIRQALRAPDEARAVLDDVGEAEGQQQAVERVAPVEPADQHALDDEADTAVSSGATSSAPQKPT